MAFMKSSFSQQNTSKLSKVLLKLETNVEN